MTFTKNALYVEISEEKSEATYLVPRNKTTMHIIIRIIDRNRVSLFAPMLSSR